MDEINLSKTLNKLKGSICYRPIYVNEDTKNKIKLISQAKGITMGTYITTLVDDDEKMLKSKWLKKNPEVKE